MSAENKDVDDGPAVGIFAVDDGEPPWACDGRMLPVNCQPRERAPAKVSRSSSCHSTVARQPASHQLRGSAGQARKFVSDSPKGFETLRVLRKARFAESEPTVRETQTMTDASAIKSHSAGKASYSPKSEALEPPCHSQNVRPSIQIFGLCLSMVLILMHVERDIGECPIAIVANKSDWIRKWLAVLSGKETKCERGLKLLKLSLERLMQTLHPNVFDKSHTMADVTCQLTVILDERKAGSSSTTSMETDFRSLPHSLRLMSQIHPGGQILSTSEEWTDSKTHKTSTEFVDEELVHKCARYATKDDCSLKRNEETCFLHRGHRSCDALRLEMVEFESRYKSMQDAFQRQEVSEKPWYEWLLALIQTTMPIQGDDVQHAAFFGCLSILQDKQTFMNKEECNALRFGIISQLCMLSLSDCAEQIPSQAIEALEHLIRECETQGGIVDDQEVLDLAVESLVEIYKVTGDSKASYAIFETLQKTQSEDVKQAVGKWCRFLEPEQEIPKNLMISKNHLSDLKLWYQRQEFVWMTSFVTGKEYRHISSLEFNMKRIQPGPNHDCQPSKSGGSMLDEVRVLTSLTKTKSAFVSIKGASQTGSANDKGIDFEDFFQDNSTDSSQQKSSRSSILLAGRPGTGKTSLCRRLAYDWSVGRWGVQFLAVFVLHINRLQWRHWIDRSPARRSSLATAIANNCFPLIDSETFDEIVQFVVEELKKTTTLLILDGLDEAADINHGLLQQAKAGNHKVFWTAQSARTKADFHLPVDMEVELLGLANSQIACSLKKDGHTLKNIEIIASFKSHQAIGDIVSNAMYLHIFSELWRKHGGSLLDLIHCRSIAWLYKKLTDFAWKRFQLEKQSEPSSNKNKLFGHLEDIALQIRTHKKTFVTPEAINSCTIDSEVRLFLLQSGFLVQKLDGRFEFSHKALCAYFAGRALARNLYSDDKKTRTSAEETLQREKYSDQFKLALSCAAGIVGDRQGIVGVRKLLLLLQRGNVDVLGLHHLGLKLDVVQQLLCESIVSQNAGFAAIDTEFRISKSLKTWLKEGLRRAQKQKKLDSDDGDLLKVVLGLLKTCPQVIKQIPQLLDILLKELKSSHWNVSNALLEALSETANATDGGIGMLMDRLGSACQHSSKEIREGGINALRLVARYCNASTELALEVARSISGHQTDIAWVRIEILKQSPDHIAKVFTDLVHASDHDYWVRRFTVSAIRDMSKANPERLPSVVDSLLDTNAVSVSVAEILGASVRACPEQRPKILTLLLSTMAVLDEDLNESAAASIAETIQAFPDCAQEVIKTVLDDVEEDTWAQRYPYLRAVVKTIAEIPGCLDHQLVDQLLDLDGDKFPGAQVIVLEAARNLSKISIQLERKMISSVIKSSSSLVWQVRHLAIDSMGIIVNKALDYVSQMADALKTARTDQAYKVRCATMVTAWKLMQASPDHASDLLALLVEGIGDEDEDVRKLAGQGIKNAVKASVQGAEDALRSLMEGFSADASKSTRLGVVHALGLLADQISDVLGILLIALEDSEVQVRLEAIEAVRCIARTDAFDMTYLSVLVFTLKNACQSTNRSESFSAVSVLADVIVANPSHAACLIEVLTNIGTCLNMKEWGIYVRSISIALDVDPVAARGLLTNLLTRCAKEGPEVQRLIVKSIREKSMKQLLSWYFMTKSDLLIPYISQKLLYIPVLFIKTSKKVRTIKWYECNGGWTQVEKPKLLLIKLMHKIQRVSKPHHASCDHRLARLCPCSCFYSFD